jgi:hypothetical protein
MNGPPKSRCNGSQQRTTGSPTGREPYGDTAIIVVVGVMPHQGGWESHPQGEGWQAVGPRWMQVHECGSAEHPRRADNWRAGCIERCTSGSEGGRWKRPVRDLASALPYQKPTSERFLNSDLLKLWLQTSSGSCAKRARALVPDSNLVEGRERERSVRPARRVPCHAHREVGAAPVRGHRCGCRSRARLAADVPAASAFLCCLKATVSCGGFYDGPRRRAGEAE